MSAVIVACTGVGGGRWGGGSAYSRRGRCILLAQEEGGGDIEALHSITQTQELAYIQHKS